MKGSKGAWRQHLQELERKMAIESIFKYVMKKAIKLNLNVLISIDGDTRIAMNGQPSTTYTEWYDKINEEIIMENETRRKCSIPIYKFYLNMCRLQKEHSGIFDIYKGGGRIFVDDIIKDKKKNKDFYFKFDMYTHEDQTDIHVYQYACKNSTGSGFRILELKFYTHHDGKISLHAECPCNHKHAIDLDDIRATKYMLGELVNTRIGNIINIISILAYMAEVKLEDK